MLAACLLAACAEYLGTSFSQIAPPEIAGVEPAASSRCGLEAVNGAPAGIPWRVSREHRIHLKGWALDGATLSSSDWVVVRLRQAGGAARFFAITWARGTNEEAARELGPGAGIARAGFDLTGTLQRVPPGSYDIDVIIGTPAGLAACATGHQLVAV